jgi:DNA polymerase III subunit epsilon
MRQIFLDTETTGLSPEAGHKVIEIGCVEYVARKPTGRVWHHYLNPQRPNDPEAFAVHGISDEFLADKPTFDALAMDFKAFVEGAELVIHNAPFDMGFLDAEFAHAGLAEKLSPLVSVTDSLKMAKRMWPGKRNGLDALCERLGVDNSSRTFHGALLDAQLLAEVYLGMTRGQNALAIDAADTPASGSVQELASLVDVQVLVLHASEEETAQHHAVLQSIEKSAGKASVWAQASAVA